MRTKNKDILMICKLWFITKDNCYDQESALCDYLKSRTMCPEIADESMQKIKNPLGAVIGLLIVNLGATIAILLNLFGVLNF